MNKKKVKEMIDRGELTPDCDMQDVNNHIHTTYSFSPYSPSRAVVEGWKAGLKTIGIMDHDSVGGCKEFVEAGKIIGMPVTVGFECRTSVKGTALEGLTSVLEGTTAIAISPEDHTAAARILSKFADTHKNFSVKSGYLDGKVVDTATIDSLAKLPTREVLLATVCNAFNAPIASFARAIQAIVDKSGEAPAAAEEAPAEA